MKQVVFILSALAMLVSLAACGGAAAETRQGTGLRNTSSTVSQILEDAAVTQAPISTEPPPDASAPAEVTPEQTREPSDAQNGEIDIDLTQLSSTLIYSEVYGMMAEPEAYLGKTVRLAGYCASGYYAPTDTTYYAVIIPDATACCAQGIEYLLADSTAYPADDTDIVITGTFEIYEELGMEYCRLGNATISA